MHVEQINNPFIPLHVHLEKAILMPPTETLSLERGTSVTKMVGSSSAPISSNKSVMPSLSTVSSFISFFPFLCLCGTCTKLPANSLLLGVISSSSVALMYTSNLMNLSWSSFIPAVRKGFET